MKEWLAFFLGNLFRKLMGSKAHASGQTVADEAAKQKEEEEAEDIFCPICNEQWEKGEIFCIYCGYELRDEELPLHPPPVRSGGLTDPDGLIEKDVREKTSEELTGLGRDKGWDIAFFILPKDLGKYLLDGGPKQEYLDGMAYCLYNTWRIGKGTGLKGLLLMIDPHSPQRALVLGRNGPKIDGSKFREWYAGFMIPEDMFQMEPGARLSREVGYILEKLREYKTA
jgi:hypothetical protein